MKADFACVCGCDAPPGGYDTSTATRDLPGILGMACEKLGLTESPAVWAWVTVTEDRAATASRAEKRILLMEDVSLEEPSWCARTGASKRTKNMVFQCTMTEPIPSTRVAAAACSVLCTARLRGRKAAAIKPSTTTPSAQTKV